MRQEQQLFCRICEAVQKLPEIVGLGYVAFVATVMFIVLWSSRNATYGVVLVKKHWNHMQYRPTIGPEGVGGVSCPLTRSEFQFLPRTPNVKFLGAHHVCGV